MEDDDIFEDPLLIEIEKSDNLENQKKPEKEEQNIIQLDEEIKFDILNKKEQTQKEQKQKKQKKEKKEDNKDNDEIFTPFKIIKKKIKSIDDLCNNFFFILFVYLINSVISVGTFYLYYKYKITLKDNILFIKIILGLIFLLIFFNITVPFLSRRKFNKKHKTCSNYALFIIINLYKIIFETVLYLLITLDQYHDQLDFPHFEVRAYWKISMCLFYILMFYYCIILYYIDIDNKYYFLLVFFIWFFPLLLFIFLTRFTQNINEFKDRFYYIIALFFEELFSMLSIFVELSDPKIQKDLEEDKSFDDSDEFIIYWRINRIDYIRSGLILTPAFSILMEECAKDDDCQPRCCPILLKSYV